MKKNIFGLLVCLLATSCLFLAGCDNNSDPVESSTDSNSPEISTTEIPVSEESPSGTSELPDDEDNTASSVSEDADVTPTVSETTTSGSNDNSDLSSFLGETDYFEAGTDTFLGNANEGEVTGNFVVKESEKVEGTFYVYLSGDLIGSLNFYVDGDMIHFSNSSMGTYSDCSLSVTDTYIKIAEVDSDAEGEDLSITICGTWYANNG